MNRARTAWFTNFPGIGNAVMVAPILSAIERRFPQLRYFHTESRVFSDRWFLQVAGLSNLRGLSPAEWRRFNTADWPAIKRYVASNSVDLIVSLRNEGPRYDEGYYRFREQMASATSSVRFLDFDFATIERKAKPRSLFLDIVDLVTPAGDPPLKCQIHWLAARDRAIAERSAIGFGLAASQGNKRWPVHKWVRLAGHLRSTFDWEIILFPGTTEADIQQALRIDQDIGRRCRVVAREPLPRVAQRISTLGCFVSNDTGLLHIAAASAVPSVGIYTNTNPDVWAPYGHEDFWPFVNTNMFKCEHFKRTSGNCLHYYEMCPTLEALGDTIAPHDVATAVVAAVMKEPRQ